MKITLQAHGRTHAAEDQCDDLNIWQVVGMFRGILLSVGYHPDTVTDALGEESSAEIGPL